MNTELPDFNAKEQSLDQRLTHRPRLRQRFLDITNMIDQAVTEGCTAHEAESRAIEQIRKLGQEVLTDGTNPFDPNPPAGVVAPQITHSPAVYYNADDDGIDDILTPEAHVITWSTLPGPLCLVNNTPCSFLLI